MPTRHRPTKRRRFFSKSPRIAVRVQSYAAIDTTAIDSTCAALGIDLETLADNLSLWANDSDGDKYDSRSGTSDAVTRYEKFDKTTLVKAYRLGACRVYIAEKITKLIGRERDSHVTRRLPTVSAELQDPAAASQRLLELAGSVFQSHNNVSLRCSLLQSAFDKMSKLPLLLLKYSPAILELHHFYWSLDRHKRCIAIAEAMINAATGRDPVIELQWWHEESVRYHEHGLFWQAKKCVSRAASCPPNDAGAEMMKAHMLHRAGEIALDEGDLFRAAQFMRQSYRIKRKHSVVEAMSTRCAWAHIVALRGRYSEACRQLEDCESSFDSFSAAEARSAQRGRNYVVDRVVEHLDEARFRLARVRRWSGQLIGAQELIDNFLRSKRFPQHRMSCSVLTEALLLDAATGNIQLSRLDTAVKLVNANAKNNEAGSGREAALLALAGFVSAPLGLWGGVKRRTPLGKMMDRLEKELATAPIGVRYISSVVFGIAHAELDDSRSAYRYFCDAAAFCEALLNLRNPLHDLWYWKCVAELGRGAISEAKAALEAIPDKAVGGIDRLVTMLLHRLAMTRYCESDRAIALELYALMLRQTQKGDATG